MAGIEKIINTLATNISASVQKSTNTIQKTTASAELGADKLAGALNGLASYNSALVKSNPIFNLLDKYLGISLNDYAELNWQVGKVCGNKRFVEILDTIEEYFKKGNYNLSKEDFINIFQEYDMSKYNKEFGDGLVLSNLDASSAAFCEYVNEKFRIIKEIIDKTPKDKTENATGYFDKIKKAFLEHEDLTNNQYNKLSSSIRYRRAFYEQTQMLLSEQEKTEIAKKYGYEDFKSFAQYFIKKYVGGADAATLKMNEDEYEKIFTSALQDAYLNYMPQETNPQVVCRWLRINKLDDFIKSFPNDEYIAQKHMSCSKNLYFAENEFKDANPAMSVKFIIFPKTKNKFLAYDVGGQKYGNNEVIYPKDTKFKVLHKGWEEISGQECSKEFINRKYVIYLQES